MDFVMLCLARNEFHFLNPSCKILGQVIVGGLKMLRSFSLYSLTWQDLWGEMHSTDRLQCGCKIL